MQGPDWQQPFVLIFEWGMFILGWTIVFVLGVMALAFVYAFFRAAYEVGRRRKNKKEQKKPAGHSGSLDDNPPKL